MAATTINTFKDLIKALEKSKNYIEEHELLSEEELNTLRQTSSLVAKFQNEALNERENRRSAELQTKEKERLVADAWKIVSELKKDKYSLELQLEKLKKHRHAANIGRLNKGRNEDQYKNNHKSDYSDQERNQNSITQTLGTTPKNEEEEVQSSPTSSSDSSEKQDSIKESTEGELSVDSDLMEELRRFLMEEDSALEHQEDEVEIFSDVPRDGADQQYSPSDIIKLFTAKPYLPTQKTKGNIAETSKKSTVTSPTNKEIPSEKDVMEKSFKTDGQESISGCFVDVELNIPRLSLADDKVIDTSEGRRKRKSFPKYEFSWNSGIGTKGSRKRESARSAISDEKDKLFGKHAPTVVSPLILNSRSSSEETTQSYREYLHEMQDRTRKYAKSINSEKGHRKAGDSIPSMAKRDSYMKLIDKPGGLPGGIVSKRIQDLAKRLKIGHSTASLRNDQEMPHSDCMDLRNPAPGICGLENLGNSCFMNAGLQCLFVVKPFYRFFLEGGHLNALETKSKHQQVTSLCVLLGRLIDKVFSGCYLTCEPTALFTSLQNKFSQLDGFIQHDCQEFLALFMDALHQELNTAKVNRQRRIRQRDMFHAKTADQWWRLYNEENESVIADTFQGQFRNKIRCTDCGHVSVTYQLFSFLSLPLVSQKLQTFVITFIRNNEFEHVNSGKPRALRVRVQASKPSTTIQIKQRLVSLFPVDEQPDIDNLFLAVVRDGAIIGLLHDQRIVTPFNDKQTKLYAYEPLYPPYSQFSAKNNTNTKNDLESKQPNTLHDTSRVFPDERKTRLVPIGSSIQLNSVKGSHACNDGRGRKTRASLPIGYHLTYTCSICLQAKPSKQLLQHDECGKVFCRECLEVSIHEDNIQCPDCSRPPSTEHNQELIPEYVNVPVLFRHKEAEEDDSALFGHPNLVTLPSKIPGEDLHHSMAFLLAGPSTNQKIRNVHSLPFTLHLVNYQGKSCSRCDEVTGCTGCCIKDNDIVVFRNGDHIAIQLTNMIQLEMDKMSRYTDHESMRIRHFTCKLQLQDCLRSFVDREELQDLWECPECKQERSATKSMYICRYPDTLIIHLKRYRQSYMKIFTPVEFPLEDLDMSEFMHGVNSPRDSFGAGDHIYDLIGCVCHEGDFESGHYKAYTRQGIKAEWHLFDDYNVSKECPSSLCHTTAYLLFYNRRSSSPPCTSMTEHVSNVVTRRSTDTKSKITNRQRHLQRKTSTEKSKDALLLPNKPQPKVDAGLTREAFDSLTEEMIDCNKEFSSTPKERITKTDSRKEKRKESYDKDHYEDEQEQPAQCDCSQCEYYREIEQQLRRCRQSVSGSEARISAVSSRGVSPKINQPRRTTPTKPPTPTPTPPTPTILDNQSQIHESPEKLPQLASSDSLDSELLYNENKTRRRSRRTSNQKPHNTSPSTSSCEAPTEESDVDNELQNVRTERQDKGKSTDSESVGTEMTDSAVQCTLINENREQRRTSTRSNAVQVSLVHPSNRTVTEQSAKEDDGNSDKDVPEHEDGQLLTQKLICAVENEDMKQAIHLLDEGANPSLLIDGISPLHLAAGMKSSLCFHFTRLFLDFGADPNVKSSDGLTPVHVASVWGKKECLKLLLKKGGNPYLEDLEGHTAVDLARDYEDDTSANTSEYLNKLDRHYTSMIHSRSCSNNSLTTTDISVSELEYVPYTHGEEDNSPRRIRHQLEEIPTVRPEMTSSARVLGCGSWTRGLKRKVKKSKVVRTVSGNLSRTSSRLANKLRSFSDHFGSSSDN